MGGVGWVVMSVEGDETGPTPPLLTCLQSLRMGRQVVRFSGVVEVVEAPAGALVGALAGALVGAAAAAAAAVACCPGGAGPPEAGFVGAVLVGDAHRGDMFAAGAASRPPPRPPPAFSVVGEGQSGRAVGGAVGEWAALLPSWRGSLWGSS